MLRTFTILILLLPMAGLAADGDTAPYTGRHVADVIDEFREAGQPFAYSTNLVSADLIVLAEPEATDPLGIVKDILRPHGLMIRSDSGVHLVVRIDSSAPKAVVNAPPAAANVGAMELETVVISASRYEIYSDLSASRFSLDQRTIQNMPDVGEDPMRIVQRLPGAAASGASAKTHFRGGEESEIGIMLNGHGLFDPFHIRDYQSIFSAIDSRAIEGVEVYTGGFPVRFGDRMSGLVLMESLESVQPRHTEIGLSVFNSSFLTAGNDTDRNWLFSARRGNLDLVIDSEFGRPSYVDVFGEYSFDISPNATLSFNALFANDNVEVILESEPSEVERVVSNTRNSQFWVGLDNRWSDELTSKIVLSGVSFDNTRFGSLGDEEKLVASVNDDRKVEQFSFRQDWIWNSSQTHLVQWGIEASYLKAQYDYANSAEYFGLQALFEDQPESSSFAATAEPRGSSYSFYFADRWRVSPKSVHYQLLASATCGPHDRRYSSPVSR
jgi:hypothetical protein